MVRAFAVWAVILAVRAASAQTVTPRIITESQSQPEPTIAVADAAPISACGKHDCPAAESAATPVEQPADNHALLKQKLAEMNCLQSEIEALRAATGTPQQILVNVKAIEVSRTKLEKMGIDFDALRREKPVATPPAYSPLKPPARPGVEFGIIDDKKAVLGLIERIRQNNIGKVLAEPNLVVISGRPAAFNVGGEIPIPTPPGAKQVVEFKQFGTQVDMLATAQGENRVRLELRARITELDDGQEIEVSGMKVPGLQVRQIDTGLDLKFGQTGVVSGFVEQRTERQERDNGVVDVVDDIELLFLVRPEAVAATDFAPRDAVGAEGYRTANSPADASPAERSLRVTKPNTPR